MIDRASTAFEAVLPWESTAATEPPSLNQQTIVQAGHYQGVASRIDYSDPAATPSQRTMAIDDKSRSLRPPTEAEIRPLSLAEAIQMALTNNPIVRVDADFLSPRSSLYLDPERTASIYDVAITQNGFQIGQRGEEAALSDFSPRLTTSMLWARDENVQNNLFQSGGLMPGDTLYQESADFNSRLEKIFGNGASVALRGDVSYSLNNAPARLFGSVYTGTVGAEYRHPLWQGAGTEFTQIAGPIARQNPTINGVNQGVVIARINADISVTGFEAEVRNQIFDVNKVYWELYLRFQQYEVQREISRGLNDIWSQVKARFRKGLEGGGAADEAQAADNYYQAVATERQALADIYEIEGRLRRLLGLTSSDGKLLRPIDAPATQPLEVDWSYHLGQALANRVELRRQKMAVRSLQLQLRAARSLVQPRADFVARYRVNAFGDRLLSSNDNDGVTPHGLRSAGATLVQGDQTGWDMGFEVAIPLGFLAERAQIRQLEWRLAKAMTALSAQEMEVQHELRNAIVQLQRWHADLQAAAQRKDAAARRVTAFRKEFELGRKPADLLLRAQISSGEAQVAHVRALAQYNISLANLAYRSGLILQQHNVRIGEGTPPQLFADAQLLISSDSQEFSLFERVDSLLAPLLSKRLTKPADWQEKSETVLRQTLPAGFFPHSPTQNSAEPAPVAAIPQPLTTDRGNMPVNAAPASQSAAPLGLPAPPTAAVRMIDSP